MKNFLQNIIIEAGKKTLNFRKKPGSLKIDRKSEKDLVTEADKAIENFLVRKIRKKYPTHAILGEEGGERSGDNYRWIIDPIDGTSSFIHQQPLYSVSIAVEHCGEIVLAAIYAPVLDEIFFAEKGKGASCNNKTIKVSKRKKLIDCILGTGFACLRSGLEHNNLPYLIEILPQIRDIRRSGSAALDMSFVACGRLDGFWELNLNIYDLAAGILILNEAGGKVSNFTGGMQNIYSQCLATNALLHNDLLDILKSIYYRLQKHPEK
ncbi:inositol monophosphatase family protein [Candidatus Riflebacteria bacterium]